MINEEKKSYLTFEESSAIKGTLILLIILGHNHILAPIEGRLFNYLYDFHVYGFFILPFLYNKKIDIKRITLLDGFIKLWGPYIFFFLLCYFVYHLEIAKDRLEITEIIYGIFNASQRTIKSVTGFAFIWFLPAYYSMTIWMMILNNRNILISIIITFSMIMLNYSLPNALGNIFTIIPFAIFQGVYYFTYGFLTRLMIDRVPYIQIIASIIFIMVSILFWDNHIDNIFYLFPISGFLFIYSISTLLSRLSLLVKIGKYSLPIYLIHVFIYNIFERLLPKEIFFGILNYLLTLSISLIVAYLIMQVRYIQKLIFPKNWNDFKSIFAMNKVIY